MSFKLIAAASMGLLVSSFGTALAAEITNPQSLAKSQHAVELLVAPVKSPENLSAYMKTHPGKDNPINLLSDAGKSRFLQSLVFRDKGLASYDYSDLEAELTLSQAYKLLSLFGAQRDIGALDNAKIISEDDRTVETMKAVMPQEPGYKDYTCFAPGDCIVGPSHICSPDACFPSRVP